MALRIDLTDYAEKRIDRLVAVGVKVSAGDAAPLLERQFEALRHTAGLGIVPQGTPTNNTETVRSGHTSHDPRHRESYALERLAEGLAGGRPTRVRLDAGARRRARRLRSRPARARRRAAGRGGAMNRVLWPATWGYFLDRMVNSTRYPPGRHVRGRLARALGRGGGRRRAISSATTCAPRGPLPAVRVGNQPYGLLPIASLDAWRPARRGRGGRRPRARDAAPGARVPPRAGDLPLHPAHRRRPEPPIRR